MIPHKLIIQGLYSYQDKQEIDFRSLVGASLFGIFGKVGSGKTSLLEAISYALYGEIERLNNRDNRLYNMMNLKSKQLLIDFEFEAGADGQRYKFVCEARRNGKKHHEVTPTLRRVFRWDDLGWQPMDAEKDDVAAITTRILGLDYENFKRTIIIPQNQFREFLELTDKERTVMMNRLFKLDKYDLSSQATKLRNQNERDLSELRGKLGPLADIDATAVTDAEAERLKIEGQIAAQQTLIGEAEATEKQWLTLQERTQQRDRLTSERADWLLQGAHYTERQQAVEQFERCVFQFKSEFDKRADLLKQEQEVTAQQCKAQRLLQEATERLPALEHQFKGAKAAFDARDILAEQRDELTIAEQIRDLQADIDARTREQTKAEALLQQQTATLETLKQQRDAAQQTITQLSLQAGQQPMLFALKNWFTAYHPLQKNLHDYDERMARNGAAVARLKDHKTDALLHFAHWQTYDLKQLPDVIAAELIALEQQRTQQQEVARQTWLQAELRQYASDLMEGRPCPLCGATHRPAQHDTEQHEDAQIAARQAEKALSLTGARIEQVRQLQLTINELLTKLRAEMTTAKELIQERAVALTALSEHLDRFQWPEFLPDDEARVDAALTAETERQQRLADAQATVTRLTGDYEAAQQQLTTRTAQVASLGTAIEGQTTQLRHQEAVLKHFEADLIKTWAPQHVAHLRQQLQTQYDKAKTDYDLAQHSLQQGEQHISNCQKEEDTQLKLLLTIKSKQTDHNQLLQKKLSQHQLTSEAVEAILASQLDVANERRAIAEYNERLASLTGQIEALDGQIGGATFDPAQLVDCQTHLAALRDNHHRLNVDLGRAREIWEIRQQQWAQKQAYDAELQQLTARQEDLEEMVRLFKAQGFVNYVSGVYLKNLCKAANERFFKLTNSQLKLELDERNSFLVRDFLNGGKVRSVKTLSGGQTFQAALSLALALSDNIQHLTNARQNLFFLDEGFGTLDKEALQTVFNTLKSLRAENRVVGIISHVEELQHEIDTYLHTERTETGSQVRCSWEM